MVTYEYNRSGNNSVRSESQNFDLLSADRAALGRFFGMTGDELQAELLLASPNLAREELRSEMFGVLQAALLGAGESLPDARDKATKFLNSLQDARQIVLRLLA